MLVIVGDSEPLNWKRVSLNFKDSLKWEPDDLNGSWTIVFSDTCKDGPATTHKLNLRDIGSSIVSLDFHSFLDLLDGLVDSTSKDDSLGFWLINGCSPIVSNTSKLEVLESEGITRIVQLLVVSLVGHERPCVDVSVPTSRDEARVIIEPMKAADKAQMSLVDHVLGVLSSVELVNINIAL
jgi:hypothetical protein